MLSRGPLKKLVSVSGETMESNRNNRQTFTAQNVVAVATHSSKCCCSGNLQLKMLLQWQPTAQNVVAVATLQLKMLLQWQNYSSKCCCSGNPQLKMLLQWQPAAQNVVAVATYSSKCCCSGKPTAQNVVAVATHSSKCCCSGNLQLKMLLQWQPTTQNIVAVATYSSKCCCSGNTTAQNVVAVAKLQLKLEPVSFNEIHSYFMILKLYPFDFYTP